MEQNKEKKTLGEMIAHYRTEKGMSQEKLAEAMGVSRQAVTKWESDLSRPSSDNLIALSQILSVTLDRLLDNGDGAESSGTDAVAAPQSRNRGPLLFGVISMACIVAYPIVSVLLDRFSIGTMILLFVLGVPCQLFVHAVFSNAARTGNFSMIAGFDSKIRYNVEEYKRLLTAIDLNFGCTSAVYVFLICVFGCVNTDNEWIGPALLLLYVFTITGNILVLNFKNADRLFVNEADRKRSRASLPIDALFILAILLEVGATFYALAVRGDGNNSPSTLGICGLMFIGLFAAIIGLAVEESRLKKWDPEKAPYRPGKCGIICAVLCVAMILCMML